MAFRPDRNCIPRRRVQFGLSGEAEHVCPCSPVGVTMAKRRADVRISHVWSFDRSRRPERGRG